MICIPILCLFTKRWDIYITRKILVKLVVLTLWYLAGVVAHGKEEQTKDVRDNLYFAIYLAIRSPNNQFNCRQINIQQRCFKQFIYEIMLEVIWRCNEILKCKTFMNWWQTHIDILRTKPLLLIWMLYLYEAWIDVVLIPWPVSVWTKFGGLQISLNRLDFSESKLHVEHYTVHSRKICCITW